MCKYPFLSNEWVDQAKRIYAEAGLVLGAGAEVSPVKVNLVVTEAPFSGDPVKAHVDTSGGAVAFGNGHLAEPDVTVSMDYLTARTLFVGGDVQAVMQAFLSGRVRVDGNLSKLLDPRSGIWPGSQASAGTASEPGADSAVSGESQERPPSLAFGGVPLQLAGRLQEITE